MLSGQDAWHPTAGHSRSWSRITWITAAQWRRDTWYSRIQTICFQYTQVLCVAIFDGTVSNRRSPSALLDSRLGRQEGHLCPDRCRLSICVASMARSLVTVVLLALATAALAQPCIECRDCTVSAGGASPLVSTPVCTSLSAPTYAEAPFTVQAFFTVQALWLVWAQMFACWFAGAARHTHRLSPRARPPHSPDVQLLAQLPRPLPVAACHPPQRRHRQRRRVQGQRHQLRPQRCTGALVHALLLFAAPARRLAASGRPLLRPPPQLRPSHTPFDA